MQRASMALPPPRSGLTLSPGAARRTLPPSTPGLPIAVTSPGGTVAPATSPVIMPSTAASTPAATPSTPMSVATPGVGTPASNTVVAAAASGTSGGVAKKHRAGGGGASRIRVLVRLRPANAAEEAAGAKCLEVKDNFITLHDPASMGLPRIDQGEGSASRTADPPRVFGVNAVLGPETTQEQVFEQIGRPVCEDVMQGYNGTIMAYGQTGAGKTFTLSNKKPEGLIARCVRYIFETAEADAAHEYTVLCSYMQIYNEQVFDLLAKDGVPLNIRESLVHGVYVEGLTELVVRSLAEVLDLLDAGRERLVFAETKMNRASSRSHALCRITVERRDRNEENAVVLRGRLMLVDLAGSERVKKSGVEGVRFKEAVSINSGLSVLGQCIQKLSEAQAQHVPYRDSKLTRLLQESLGGNSKTNIVVCVSPAAESYFSTLSSLRFAIRAMQVQLNPKVNRQIDYERYATELAQQLEALQDQHASMKAFIAQQLAALRAAAADIHLTADAIRTFTSASAATRSSAVSAAAESASRDFVERLRALERTLLVARLRCVAAATGSKKRDVHLRQGFAATSAAQLATVARLLVPECIRRAADRAARADELARAAVIQGLAAVVSNTELAEDLCILLRAGVTRAVRRAAARLLALVRAAPEAPHWEAVVPTALVDEDERPDAGARPDAAPAGSAAAIGGGPNAGAEATGATPVTSAAAASAAVPAAAAGSDVDSPNSPARESRAKSLREIFSSVSAGTPTEAEAAAAAAAAGSTVPVIVEGLPPPVSSDDEEDEAAEPEISDEATRAQVAALQAQFTEIASALQVVRAGLSGDDGARLKSIMTSLREAVEAGLAKRPSALHSGLSAMALLSPSGADTLQAAEKLMQSAHSAVAELQAEVERLAAHFMRCVVAGEAQPDPQDEATDDSPFEMLSSVEQRATDAVLQGVDLVEREALDELLTTIQRDLTALHTRDTMDQTIRAQGDRIARLLDKRDRHRHRIELLEEEVDGAKRELTCWRAGDAEGAAKARAVAEERRAALEKELAAELRSPPPDDDDRPSDASAPETRPTDTGATAPAAAAPVDTDSISVSLGRSGSSEELSASLAAAVAAGTGAAAAAGGTGSGDEGTAGAGSSVPTGTGRTSDVKMKALWQALSDTRSKLATAQREAKEQEARAAEQQRRADQLQVQLDEERRRMKEMLAAPACGKGCELM